MSALIQISTCEITFLGGLEWLPLDIYGRPQGQAQGAAPTDTLPEWLPLDVDGSRPQGQAQGAAPTDDTLPE
jgi:hypothetical protein